MKNNIKTLALGNDLAVTAILLGLAMIAPLAHSQLITGTIVNGVLFAAVMKVGFRAAAAVAVIPSLVALAAGTLPASMAVMVPYIMASNIALVGIFAALKRVDYWLAAAIASIAKFGVLTMAATFVLAAATHGKISLALASMMGWPQLVTALLGALAFGAIIKIKK